MPRTRKGARSAPGSRESSAHGRCLPGDEDDLNKTGFIAAPAVTVDAASSDAGSWTKLHETPWGEGSPRASSANRTTANQNNQRIHNPGCEHFELHRDDSPAQDLPQQDSLTQEELDDYAACAERFIPDGEEQAQGGCGALATASTSRTGQEGVEGANASSLVSSDPSQKIPTQDPITENRTILYFHH